MDDYRKRLTQKTKAGNTMSRMAHMELAMQAGIGVNLGDVIMYVNNGLKASHGDVQKKGDGVQLNCYMLDKDILENDPDLKGDYNVPRAITTFNKRIEPLLVCFLVTIPMKISSYGGVGFMLVNPPLAAK